MSLTSALSIAQSALLNTSRQTSILSRNVSEASNPNYSRRSAVLTSMAPGARITEIRRATDEVLFRHNLASISAWQAQGAVSDGLDTLQLTVNGADNATSASTALGKLQEALQLYASMPSNRTLAESAVQSARQMVQSLNQGSAAIQTFRSDTDKEIATAVDDLNRLLADFERVNKEVVAGTRAGRDISDALDQRDTLLKKISEYVPVSTIKRTDNDLVIMTDGGAILFETVPRPVTFAPTAAYSPGASGNAVYIDGVPLAEGSGGNTSASGLIAAKLQLRDQVATGMQRQLDEVARGLITAFAESDPNGTLPDAAGLFTWSGGPDIPDTGVLIDGLAGSIRINTAVDSAQGGNPELLRDGGINGNGYIHNTDGAASFSSLLRSYGEKLDEPMDFDALAGLETTTTLGAFSANAIGWLEGLRKDAASGLESKEALATRTATALSNATGVNVDEEMSLLLELEHSYEATARLIRALDEMLGTLLEAAG